MDSLTKLQKASRKISKVLKEKIVCNLKVPKSWNFRRNKAGNNTNLKSSFSSAIIKSNNGKGEFTIDEQKFYQAMDAFMPLISNLPRNGIKGNVAITGGNPAQTSPMTENLCVRITSRADQARDGAITYMGFGLDGITKLYASAQPSPVMVHNFPVNCSTALVTARTWGAGRFYKEDEDEDEDDPAGAVDMYPYKGWDQPRTFVISDGNPNWDKIRLQGPEGGVSGGAAEEHEVDDDWDEVDDFDAKSVTLMEPVHPAPLVRFQEIPPDVRALASKVYITCTDEVKPQNPVIVPVGSEICLLDREHPLSGFLNTMHHQAIGLSQTPVPDQDTPTPVDPTDEMFEWLGRSVGWETAKEKRIPDGFQVPNGFALALRKVSQWPLTDRKTTRLQFEMTVPFLSGPRLRFSTDDGAKATFSRVDETDQKLGNDGAWTRGVTSKGLEEMLVHRRTIVFGLEDLKTPVKTTLKDLATFMRFNIIKHPLLSYLTDAIPLTLDTSKDFHNAIWFRPAMNYQTVTRLQFHVDTTKFNEWLSYLSPTLKVEALRIIGKKTASWVWAVPLDEMSFTSSLTFLCRMKISSTLALEGVFEFNEKQSASLILTLNQSSSSALRVMSGPDGWLKDIMTWLGTHLGIKDQTQFDYVIDKATDSGTGVMNKNSIIPRRLTIQLALDANGNIKGVKNVSIDIEVCLTIGRPVVAKSDEMPAVFLFTIGWAESRGFHLKGKLWSVLPKTPFDAYDRALHEVEEYDYLQPMSPLDKENQRRTIDLARLLSDGSSQVSDFPVGIPNEIYMCEISLDKEKVAFTGRIRCSKPENSGGGRKPPPTLALKNLELEASYTWGTKDARQEGFKLELAIELKLFLGGELNKEGDWNEQQAAAARLNGRVIYDKGNWSIEGSVSSLSIHHLLQFWDVDDRGPITDFLGGINIDYVNVKYEYNKTNNGAFLGNTEDIRSPSLLKIDGQFTFAQVATLKFKYTNEGGDEWAFKAGLGPSQKTKDTATIGGLLSGFIEDPLVVNSLPDAIRNAKIQGADGTDDDSKQPLRMIIAKKGGTSVFALLVNIEKVSVWFVQLRQGPNGAVKRFLKAAVSKISVDVPAFQTTINSPWEDFSFSWVQDQTAPKEGVLTGITKSEYDAMAEVMKDKLGVKSEQLLLFKPVAEKEPGGDLLQITDGKGGDGKTDDKAKKVVMAAGFHLLIVAKKSDGQPAVILDYLFGTKKKAAEEKSLVPYAATGKSPDASGAEKSIKAPYKVKIGPLSVGNVGLWFKDGLIGVTLDASLVLGPIGLSLLGFTIGVPFGGDYSLANPPPPSSIEWGLKGLILALDKPPLTVAGGFMRDDSSDPDIEVMYAGGLIVGLKPWSFEAMGAYATVKKKKKASGGWITTIRSEPMSLASFQSDMETEDNGTFTFSFIYVKMNGPLFSIGFADFAGLVGGIGVNSDITIPTVQQVTQHPFIAERDSSESSPVERMQSLLQGSWFRPGEGLYWAAAGARVTAFQMLAANIVIILQFGNGNLLFGIFGVATGDIPSLESPIKFAHIELGIVCTFDVNSGIFKFEAQLSPRSFVLAPQCHLTGGIALFAWSKADNSDKDSFNHISAGDFVLTIGGYHRAFKAPKQYPNPPRLGISWSLSSCLSIKGEAYFAITPKVCMGGGRLRAALNVGLLYAWFDALVDFLMNFEPFFFQMSARVSVGVKFTLDLWLVTIRISVEIGAGLDLRGPAFGGVVHVDFWVFGFDIAFGPSSKPPQAAISLDRFFAVAAKTGSAPKALTQGESQPDAAAIVLTCETGLLPPLQNKDKDKKAPKPSSEVVEKWYVKGGKFSLLASFQIPVTMAELVDKRNQVTDTGEKQVETRRSDCAISDTYKKVYAKPMQLYDPLVSAVTISVKSPDPRKKENTVHTLDNWEDQKWKLIPQIKPVETSIWGQYDRNQDPTFRKGPIQGLLDGKNATVQLVKGVSILPPDPAMAGDLVNKFNIAKDHVSSVFDPTKSDWPLFIGVLKDQDKAWSPRKSDSGRKWSDVTDAWSKVGDATRSNVVNLWAKRMRYDKASVDGDEKDETLKGTFEPLRGLAPRKLLDKYEQLVPALPQVAVGFPGAEALSCVRMVVV